jgi:hypothetical protein
LFDIMGKRNTGKRFIPLDDYDEDDGDVAFG